MIESQIRTPYQHIWAELSEKLADRYGFALKYGGGPEDVRGLLKKLSQGVGTYEISESEALFASNRLLQLNLTAQERPLADSERAEIAPLLAIADLHNESLGKLRAVIRSVIDELKGRL